MVVVSSGETVKLKCLLERQNYPSSLVRIPSIHSHGFESEASLHSVYTSQHHPSWLHGTAQRFCLGSSKPVPKADRMNKRKDTNTLMEGTMMAESRFALQLGDFDRTTGCRDIGIPRTMNGMRESAFSLSQSRTECRHSVLYKHGFLSSTPSFLGKLCGYTSALLNQERWRQ